MILLNYIACILFILPSPLHAAPAFHHDQNHNRTQSNHNGFTRMRNLTRFIPNWNGFLCQDNCRQFYGWSGHHFGTDSWGQVLLGGNPIVFNRNQTRPGTGNFQPSNTSLVAPTSATANIIPSFFSTDQIIPSPSSILATRPTTSPSPIQTDLEPDTPPIGSFTPPSSFTATQLVTSKAVQTTAADDQNAQDPVTSLPVKQDDQDRPNPDLNNDSGQNSEQNAQQQAQDSQRQQAQDQQGTQQQQAPAQQSTQDQIAQSQQSAQDQIAAGQELIRQQQAQLAAQLEASRQSLAQAQARARARASSRSAAAQQTGAGTQ